MKAAAARFLRSACPKARAITIRSSGRGDSRKRRANELHERLLRSWYACLIPNCWRRFARAPIVFRHCMIPYMNAGQPHPITRNWSKPICWSYLPDDLLIKADRCSMQASLEARAPFLDHQLAEYAAAIPFNLKLKGSAHEAHSQRGGARYYCRMRLSSGRSMASACAAGRLAAARYGPGARELLLSRRARERGLLEMPRGRAAHRRARIRRRAIAAGSYGRC